MDIMDIQAVESKLSDVTVTPIPRSQVQNFYNYQQQREQREQQPQIQISAIHHVPRERHGERAGASGVHGGRSGGVGVGIGDPQNLSKHEREYHQQTTSPAAAVAAVKAMQMSQIQQQLQAQLAASMANAVAGGYGGNNGAVGAAAGASNNNNAPNVSIYSSSSSNAGQLKYPAQATSPAIVTTQTSANITTPMTSSAGLPSLSMGMSGSTSKYALLLAIIEDMGRDIRPTYTGSRSSTERLKRGIVTARMLVRECLMETERSARP